MSKILIFVVLIILLFVQSCAVHHPQSRHHGSRHGAHVAIHTGVLIGGHHGHYRHSRHNGNLIGALIVGGIIGHILTEAAHEEVKKPNQPKPPAKDTEDQAK